MPVDGGGMLVLHDGDFIAHARKLATQVRDAAPHYQHSEIGYNYRLSNVLADIGRGEPTSAEAPWGRHTRWHWRRKISKPARAQWAPGKPMHLQPVFAGYESVGGQVAEEFFTDGLCLPSGSSLTEEELARVVAVVQRVWQGK